MSPQKYDSENLLKNQLTLEEYQVMDRHLLHPIQHTGRWGKIWIASLLLICLLGIGAYYIQETKGKYVTISLRDYTIWGVYISNFIFLESLSIICVLISAILHLIHFEWYRPLSRIAQLISVAAIMFAGLSIVVAMGRPDRLHYIFLHGRIQSPIVWDVAIITTYLVTSIALLFIPLIPSIATMKKNLTNKPKWQMKMYNFLSFGWEGSAEQWNILKKLVKILTIAIIPLGITVNTIGSWLFATTPRSEWDSANFGIYFVAGAFLLGAAGIIVTVFVIRKAYKLELYLTNMHFDKLGKALVLLSLIYIYININEYFIPSYKMDGFHSNHLMDLFVGKDAILYWSVTIFGMIIPAILPLFRKMRKPVPLTIIAATVVIAAWLKRYLIVIPGLVHPYLPIQDVPESWNHYSPSIIEMTIVMATIAGMLLVITLFSKFFPIISVWEIAEGKLEGKTEIIDYEN